LDLNAKRKRKRRREKGERKKKGKKKPGGLDRGIPLLFIDAGWI